ncbi:MAG: ATP-binding cassette domain-containing protein [Candidatus Thermoplasmatota archaeon]
MSIIETKNLTKKYGSLTAVDHISFDVEEGEVFGFLGPNGAGKTTTVRMLITLIEPTEGTAEIAGYDIRKQKNEVRKKIGVVFQEPALDTELTGIENLEYHARMYNIKKNIRKERIKEVLELVDLSDKKDVIVKKYSGGMKRRLEIARGLMHSPTVLFLDEPTLGLDAQTRRVIWEYIERMNREENTTIFLTTHYMDEADYLCDRVGIINRGQILVMDKIKNLKNAIGNDVITLSASKIKPLKEELERYDWIKKIKQYDHFLTLGVEKGEEKIPLVIEIASKINVKIKSINVRKPTLDDVFISYTGKTLSEQENQTSVPPSIKNRGKR